MEAVTILPPTSQTIFEVQVQSAHCSTVGVAACLLISQHCTEVGYVVWRKCSRADFKSASYTCDMWYKCIKSLSGFMKSLNFEI